MTTTYKADDLTIGQIVEIGATLKLSWFRGHAKCYGDLTPRIFRPEYAHPVAKVLMGDDREYGIIEAFRRRAPALTRDLPSPDDAPGWLFLMQHHGAPTRLLDWTESVLIATYFAVEHHESEDGELWAMCPAALNQHTFGSPGLPVLWNSPTLQYLAREPGHTNPEQLAKELGRKDGVPKFALAVQPALTFPRMVVQRSVFTIHPRDQKQTIPALLTEEKHLVRYIIPARRKLELKRDLAALGISRGALFPDLDSLSRDIVTEHNVSHWSLPDPPNWGLAPLDSEDATDG